MPYGAQVCRSTAERLIFRDADLCPWAQEINLDKTYGIEFGGGNVDENPCTRNGFTGSENGKVTPEWNLKKDGVGYDNNALMTKIENGKIVEQYRYVQKENLWRKIK